eukprot:8397093-Alexandrium_andersonii.AAC.1
MEDAEPMSSSQSSSDDSSSSEVASQGPSGRKGNWANTHIRNLWARVGVSRMPSGRYQNGI